MAETEIIKLKKEIHNLREHNADLQADLEEKNQKLGKFENDYLKMKNETMLVTKTKLLQQSEILKLNVEKALEGEKARIIFLEKNYEEALQKIAYLEQEKGNLEAHLKDVQVLNNSLKKQVLDFGTKTNTTDILSNLRERDETLIKKEKDYQKLVTEWNTLCDKMEDILSENRLLKEIANVPANFGINIEEIKLGDRMKIEDYKAKIRILQREVDDLETERATLKHKLLFFANSLELKEPPFNNLTTEQKKAVGEYAQALYEGKDFILPERYELIKEKESLNNKIDFLEKQISSMQLERDYKFYGFVDRGDKGDKNVRVFQDGQTNPAHGGIPGYGHSELVDILKKENEDLKSIINGSLNNLSKNIIDGDLQGSNGNFSKGSKYNNGNNKSNSPYLEYNYLQMPAVPLNQESPDLITQGYSYRLDSKFKIDPNSLHNLFGIAKDEGDIEAFKIESASLQSQLIEVLEFVSRSKSQDTLFSDNLDKIYSKLESLIQTNHSLVSDYLKLKRSYTSHIEESTKRNKVLLNEVNDLKRKDKALEDTFKLLETKNLDSIQKNYIEKVKENAIITNTNIQLTRKHEALLDEECKLRKLYEDSEEHNKDKFAKLEASHTKLKEWKTILTFYLKFLMKKVKSSVDKSDYERVSEENNYLREKYNEIVVRDIDVTKQISENENMKIRLKESEQSFYNSEEMRIDCEIELNYIKTRLQKVDPEFYQGEKVLRLFVRNLIDSKLTFNDLRKIFDVNFSGKISKSEFVSGLKNLNLFDKFADKVDILINTLHPDEDMNIDVFYFVRKLERMGIFDGEEYNLNSESKENWSEVLQSFIEGIKKSGVSLKSAFELFDTSGDGKISKEEFKFAMNQLNLKVSDEVLNKILSLITKGQVTNSELANEDVVIDYFLFCDLFEERARYVALKTKKYAQIKSNLKIDWKINLMSVIVEGIKKNDLTFLEAFHYLDKDHSGVICKPEFTNFLRRINVNFSEEEISALFSMLDKDSDGKVEPDEFVNILKDCEEQIQAFKRLAFGVSNDNYSSMNDYNTDNKNINNLNPALNSKTNPKFGGNNNPSNINNLGNNSFNNNTFNNTQNQIASNNDMKLQHKYNLIIEKEKYYIYKINQMRQRLEEVEKVNKQISSQVEEYVKKHAEMMDKYFSSTEELQRIKSSYLQGVTRTDMSKLELENDNLAREVTITRVGLNTFKDLYKSTCRQVNDLRLKAQRNEDEIDTYKKAIKDLQSETNDSALIGKLYYSLLISRWREAATLRKYEDFISEVNTLREDNYVLDNDCKKHLITIADLTSAYHEKTIELIKSEERNEINQMYSTQAGVNSHNDKFNEYKTLIQQISNDKSEITEKYLKFRKENLLLKTEVEEMKSKIDYSENIVEKIKFNSKDEYSKKLIMMSEEVAKLKMSLSASERELYYMKETETSLNRIVEHLKKTVKDLDSEKATLEGEYRKVDEIWRKRDEERQKKFFEKLGNINENYSTNSSIEKGANFNPQNNSQKNAKYISELESKIKSLNEILSIKTNEIELMKDTVKNTLPDVLVIDPLLRETDKKLIQDDETRLVAQTAHKTIKTLQDLIDSKNSQLNKKEQTVETLKSDLIKMKEYYLNVVSNLQAQISLDHESTMSKLKSVLENVNGNMLVKITKSELSTMTLADIESLLEEKDQNLKTLALELKHTKEENEINYLKISELNQKISHLNFENEEKRYLQGTNSTSPSKEVEKLRRIIKLQSQNIEDEKNRVKKITEDFNLKLQDRTLLEEQVFHSSVNIPERLKENSEKTEYYAKVQTLRNKNKKMKLEIEKLNKTIEEFKKTNSDLIKSNDKIKNENKMFLQSQVKDTKTISRLKKEKEDCNLELTKLKEKMELIQKEIESKEKTASVIPVNNSIMLDENKNKIKRNLSTKKITTSVNTNPSIIEEIIVNSNSNSKIAQSSVIENNKQSKIQSEVNTSGAILQRLVFFCLKKNINMMRHLQRYDLPKLGKILKSDFSKAIDELKLGFIDNDIKTLTDSCNFVENYLDIKTFINKMVETDKNYELLIKENGKLLILNISSLKV